MFQSKYLQKQSPGGVLLKRQRQANTCFRAQPAALLKKRLRHWCFPVNFAKFLRTPLLKENFRLLLLSLRQRSKPSSWALLNICNENIVESFLSKNGTCRKDYSDRSENHCCI